MNPPPGLELLSEDSVASSENEVKIKIRLKFLHVHVVILLGFGGSFFMFKQ